MFLLILQRGAGFLTKLVMANSVTPYEYGIITLVAISIPGMLQIITNLNFFQILSHSEHGRDYFGFALLSSLVLVSLSSLILYMFSDEIFAYLNLPPHQSGLYLTAIVVSMFCISAVLDFQGVFNGMKLYSAPGILEAIPSVARLITVCILMGIGVTSVAIYIVVFALSNAIPLLYIAISRYTPALLKSAITIQIPSKKMFGFGTAVFIAGNFTNFGQYFNRIVVSHELGVEWQGFYDVSQTLATSMIFAISTMVLITVPEATSLENQVLHENEGLGGVTRGLFALVLFFALLLCFFSKFLVITIFSSDYAPAAEYVYIIAIGYIFFFIQFFLSQVNLSWAKRGREYILLTVIPLCLIPLIPFVTSYLIALYRSAGYGNGFIGAYVSFTLFLVLLTILTILICKDLSPIRILLKKVDRLILSLALPSLLICYLRLSPVIGIFLFASMFGILIFATGYLRKELILSMFNKSAG